MLNKPPCANWLVLLLIFSGNLRKLFRHDMINFVSIFWKAVIEETVKESFKCYGISVEIDSSKDGLFNSQLSK